MNVCHIFIHAQGYAETHTKNRAQALITGFSLFVGGIAGALTGLLAKFTGMCALCLSISLFLFSFCFFTACVTAFAHLCQDLPELILERTWILAEQCVRSYRTYCAWRQLFRPCFLDRSR
jgi:hypothetical protein